MANDIEWIGVVFALVVVVLAIVLLTRSLKDKPPRHDAAHEKWIAGLRDPDHTPSEASIGARINTRNADA